MSELGFGLCRSPCESILQRTFLVVDPVVGQTEDRLFELVNDLPDVVVTDPVDRRKPMDTTLEVVQLLVREGNRGEVGVADAGRVHGEVSTQLHDQVRLDYAGRGLEVRDVRKGLEEVARSVEGGVGIPKALDRQLRGRESGEDAGAPLGADPIPFLQARAAVAIEGAQLQGGQAGDVEVRIQSALHPALENFDLPGHRGVLQQHVREECVEDGIHAILQCVHGRARYGASHLPRTAPLRRLPLQQAAHLTLIGPRGANAHLLALAVLRLAHTALCCGVAPDRRQEQERSQQHAQQHAVGLAAGQPGRIGAAP
mmetsp:Transcript_25088/g.50872  ORF Transcript_25088/g.50872 Transcript_25088/m.50872 type:complete len:313 (-) Transcript_25088:35-973(-)